MWKKKLNQNLKRIPGEWICMIGMVEREAEAAKGLIFLDQMDVLQIYSV